MKFAYKDSVFLNEEKIQKCTQIILPYTQKLKNIKPFLYDLPESSINLPSDNTVLNEVENLVKKLTNHDLKYIIDIGIGGSNLGTKAVYDALYGFFDVIEPDRLPKMFFADTNNSVYLYKLITFLKDHVKKEGEILINVISKSGTTTETIANFEIIGDSIEKILPDYGKRIVITTDKDSKLWQMAQNKGFAHISIPKVVGGRYSVLSSVGLLPLAAAGINIKAFRKGANRAVANSLEMNFRLNNALLSAVILFLHLQEGKIINDNFFFHAELESLGKWYRQLMGESIGKDGKGITPTVSIGSTDLHSVAQLYYGGPHDKVTTLVWSFKNTVDISLPAKLKFDNLVSNIENKKASAIMQAIIEGVKISYKNERMPYMEIVLDDLSEESLGEYMQFKMIEMMYLGKLLGVNAFDQPHVELYKKEMKKKLEEK